MCPFCLTEAWREGIRIEGDKEGIRIEGDKLNCRAQTLNTKEILSSLKKIKFSTLCLRQNWDLIFSGKNMQAHTNACAHTDTYTHTYIHSCTYT